MKPRKAAYGAIFAAFLFVSLQIARLAVTVWRDEARFSCNAWGAFGIPFSPAVLVLLGLAALALFFFGFRAATTYAEALAWVVLVAAGASNLFERISFGCVTDYIFLPHIPTFNLADLLLTMSVIALVLKAFVPDRAHKDA